MTDVSYGSDVSRRGVHVRNAAKVAATAIVAMVFAVGCASSPDGYGRDIDQAERDRIHATIDPPAIESDHVYVAHTVTAVIPVDSAALVEWIMRVPLEDVLPGTDRIAGAERTENLSPAWGPDGSRRRVVLEDGNTALEQLIHFEPGSFFEYQVWNFTNIARFATEYAIGRFSVAPVEGGTLLTWTYRFRPHGPMTTGGLRWFVRTRYQAFMAASMEVIEQLSVEQLGS